MFVYLKKFKKILNSATIPLYLTKKIQCTKTFANHIEKLYVPNFPQHHVIKYKLKLKFPIK